MSSRARMVLLLCLGILVGVAGTWVSAQVRPQRIDPHIVLSGPDVGFSISAKEGQTPVGQLVVRINGMWVPAKLGGEVTYRFP